MSIAEKLTTIAQNEQKVYEAGKKAERDAFWESFQKGGNQNTYAYAFRGSTWTDEIYYPLYPIKGDMQQIYSTTSITDTKVPLIVEGSLISGFQGSNVRIVRELDLTKCSNFSRAFYGAVRIEQITFVGTIKLSGLDVSACSRLNKASLLTLLNCLEDKSGDSTGGEVILGTTNKNKLTAEELAIAENKGWTVN